MTLTLHQHTVHIQAIRRAIHSAADPGRCVERAWPKTTPGPTRLLALGKASVPMAHAAAALLGSRLVDGLVVAPPELLADQSLTGFPIELLPADHPLPTARNTHAASRVGDVVTTCPEDHDLLVLISGGGSAHLTLPAPPLTLDDLREVTDRLLRAGATIRELNTVRKHLEQLKGGRLLASCRARTITAMVLSDVVCDPLDVIASGPCVPDPTTYADALGVLDRFALRPDLPKVAAFLDEGRRGFHPETPKPGEPNLSRVTTRIIGSNRMAVDAARACAADLGFRILKAEQGIEGEARAIGERLARECRAIGTNLRPAAVILGGEPTVTVGDAQGLGGPSQEVALSALALLHADDRVAILAYSTDGRDGPTDAAGAVVSSLLVLQAKEMQVDLAAALARHDSHRLLDEFGALIRTGPTGTNVNHVFVALAYVQ